MVRSGNGQDQKQGDQLAVAAVHMTAYVIPCDFLAFGTAPASDSMKGLSPQVPNDGSTIVTKFIPWVKYGFVKSIFIEHLLCAKK